MSPPRRALFICLVLSTACLELPELEQLEPPLADFGGELTWGPLDEPGSGGPDPGSDPPSGDGGAGDSGASDPGSGLGTPPDPALAQLRLTEVLVDPPGRDGDPDSPEFIELHNPGPGLVALDGLVIDARSWPTLDAAELGLLGVSLEPGAILLVRRYAKDIDPARAGLDIDPTSGLVTIGFLDSGGLRNADGHVRILAGPDAIDELVYGAPPEQPSPGWSGAPVDASGSGVSLCRDTDTADHDGAQDWSACPPNPGVIEPIEGPGELPTIAPGELQIVEVAANPPGPASEEKAHEYVELLNMSDKELELSGCRIGDAEAIDAPGVDPLAHLSGEGGCVSPTCLAPGRRALIVGQGYVDPSGDALVLSTDDSTIADGGLTNTEPVVLWDAQGNMISSYRLWGDPTIEPLPSDEQPLHRLDPTAPDEPLEWQSAPASPGN